VCSSPSKREEKLFLLLVFSRKHIKAHKSFALNKKITNTRSGSIAQRSCFFLLRVHMYRNAAAAADDDDVYMLRWRKGKKASLNRVTIVLVLLAWGERERDTIEKIKCDIVW
jgi:hypothetical protein